MSEMSYEFPQFRGVWCMHSGERIGFDHPLKMCCTPNSTQPSSEQYIPKFGVVTKQTNRSCQQCYMLNKSMHIEARRHMHYNSQQVPKVITSNEIQQPCWSLFDQNQVHQRAELFRLPSRTFCLSLFLSDKIKIVPIWQLLCLKSTSQLTIAAS